MQYDNTNKGSFFVNEQKKTEKHPDYSGKINIEGTEYYLSGWKKQSKTGKHFLSLSIKPVQQDASGNSFNNNPPIRQNQPDPFASGGDQIPF